MSNHTLCANLVDPSVVIHPLPWYTKKDKQSLMEKRDTLQTYITTIFIY